MIRRKKVKYDSNLTVFRLTIKRSISAPLSWLVANFYFLRPLSRFRYGDITSMSQRVRSCLYPQKQRICSLQLQSGFPAVWRSKDLCPDRGAVGRSCRGTGRRRRSARGHCAYCGLSWYESHLNQLIFLSSKEWPFCTILSIAFDQIIV